MGTNILPHGLAHSRLVSIFKAQRILHTAKLEPRLNLSKDFVNEVKRR
jgi:hypothetical protein